MGQLNPSKNQIRTATIICLLAVSGILADSTCRKGCPKNDNGLLHYARGSVYEYGFESILTVGLSAHIGDIDSDDTNLNVVGIAKLYAEGNCGYTMQLHDVQVTASKEQVAKKITQSINKPVHFTMAGGKIEPEICTDGNDATYALNVKRAIISLFQSSTAEETEVDVFGQCPTQTSVSKIGDAEILTKVRNLNACGYREQIRNGILSGVVNDKSGIKSTMLIKADYSKEAKLKHGVIESVHLIEEYSFTGASKNDPGVNAKVSTTLTLKNSGPSNAPGIGSQPASIVFQKPEAYTVKNIGALKTALSKTVELVDSYVKKDAAKQFIEMIRLMRLANTDTLLELASVPLPNRVLGRKVYLDALFRAGTSESVKAIIKQINKMNDQEKMIAMLSMNFVQTVDKETMNQASTLLGGSPTKETYLAVGHIVSKYCQSFACGQTDIEGISKKFLEALKRCRANNKKEEDRMVYILKGIRNARHITNSVVAAIKECASTGHSNRIRVAALQAFAAASCDSQLQQKALELLNDQNEDSELRIEAYLAAIECPSAELSNQIAEIVNNELVHQVGGFIASSLKTIRDSTDSKRASQRHYLGNIHVTKNFPKDYRRFSFENEISYSLDALGLSASSDYQLIYSQHGFLPRSARLNVSTEVFGTNFNVLEANVRQENLEHILEYYLGPKGLLNKDFDEIIGLIQGGESGAGHRARRSIADDTGKFAKRYKNYGTESIDDLNLDLSLKLFGTEMLFMSLGDNIPNSLDDVIKHFSTLFDDVKNGLSSFNKEFKMHSFFMDSEFLYPTGVGFPLELSAQGFSANKLDMGIELDIDTILQQNWHNARYRVKLVPSVDVNVNMKLGFNAYVLATGTRIVSSLHSATGSDIHFEFTEGGKNGFNIDIELPREKMELINLQLSTDFFIAEQDKEVRTISSKSAKKRKQGITEDCFNQFEIIGCNVCFATNIQQLETALSRDGAKAESQSLLRPFVFSLYMTSERKFNIKGYHVPERENGAQQWKLDYSTPGSTVSHDTSLTFETGVKSRLYAALLLDHPQYHFGLEAGLLNDNKELVWYGQYKIDNEIRKSKIGFLKNGNVFRPVIEVQDRNGVSNEINGYRAEGRVVVQNTGENQARYNFENFQVVNRDNERIVVNGWIELGTVFFDSELHVAPGQDSYFVKSNLKMDNGEFSVGTFINNEKTPDNVFGGSVGVKLGENEVSIDLVGKINTWHVESTNIVQYGNSNGNNAIDNKFQLVLSLRKANNLVASVKLSGLTEGQDKIEVDVEVVRGRKIASLALKFSGNQRNQGDYQLKLNGVLNKHFVEISATCDVKGNAFHVNNEIKTSWGTHLTAKGDVGHRFTAQEIHIDLQGVAKFSGKENPSQWILKVLGSVEKTNSEFKLLRDNAEIIKYIGDFQHPQDKLSGGKVIVQVRNVMTSKGDFKIAKNGKGEFSVNIDMLKTEPKHKFELVSNFHIQAPKYDVEFTATFDNDKKIYYKTENIVEKMKFSTKNIAEGADKKIAFDASGMVKGEWRMNGELQGNFALTCPGGRSLDGTLKRKVLTNAKTGISQGSMEVQINDQQANGQKRSIVMNSKLEKGNIKTKEMYLSSHFVYTNFDEKKLDLVNTIKHLFKQQKKSIELKVTTSGELASTPIDIGLQVEDYTDKSATFVASCRIGEYFSGKANGNYNLGDRGSPVSYELQGNLQMPNSNFKIIELSSNAKFMKEDVEEGSTYMAEINLDERSGNDQFIKFNSIWKCSRRQGTFNVGMETQQMNGAMKIEGSYQRDNEVRQQDGSIASGKQKYAFNLNYADKYFKTTSDMSFSGADTASIHYTLDSSFESAKEIDIMVRCQKTNNEVYMLNMQVKAAGNTYVVESKIFGSTQKKGIDLRATISNGEPVVIVGILEVLGEKRIKLTLDIANLADLDLKGNLEASYKGVGDFYVMGEWSSIKLNLDNYNLDIHSQREAIVFNLKRAQGVILAGSATYALKTEKNKSVLEGQGQLQYNGKNQNTNFKLIRQHYDEGTDKEVGFSYTFNGNLGPKNSVSTLKITNKEFNVKISVCEEKKQCTNVQVQSIVAVDEQNIDSLQHSLLVLIDLREFGYPHEFELQSKTIRQGFKSQYSLDSSLISDHNMKYQLIANVMQPSCKIQVKLPNREISFETQQRFPENGRLFGHYENSATFYFDKKNKPNDVTRLSASADLTGIENIAINANGRIKLEHPTIRSLTVSGKLDANSQQHFADAELILDIFRVPEQQIVALTRIHNSRLSNGFNVSTSHILRSDGLGIQHELNGHAALNIETHEMSAGSNWRCSMTESTGGIFVFRNKERMNLQIHGMNEQLLEINGVFNRQKYSSQFDSKIQLFGPKAIEIRSELHPSMMKFSLQREGLIDATGEIKLGKEAKFNILSAGKPLYNGRIAFDSAKFLQHSFERDEEAVKSFLETVQLEVKKDADAVSDKTRKRFQKMRDSIDRQIHLAKQSTPDFSQLKNHYEQNVNEIAKELESDSSLKQIIETYRKLYDTLVKAISELAKTVGESYEKFHESFVVLHTKLETIFKDTILPPWEEFSVHFAQLIGTLRAEVISLHTKTFHFMLEAIEKYGPAMKNYGKMITESLKPVQEAAQELYKVIAHAAEELIIEIKEHIAKLPTFDALHGELKKELKKLKLVETALEFFNNLFEQLHILPQTAESAEFLQSAHEYIEAKLKQENVDDEKLIEELYKLLVKALSSLWASLGVDAGRRASDLSVIGISSIFTSLPHYTDSLSKLPALLSLRFSLFNLMLNENWINIFTKDFSNNWLYFENFKLHGHIADGRHFFTFDGIKISFSGTCKYILAQDSHDNNFTVIAQVNSGKLKSIIITDRDGGFIEVNDAGVLKLNGAPVEFPQHTPNMNAWRRFYTVWLRSEYGVQVMCSSDLKVCHLEVNGFYTSKTRGLLGNGNAEPYDDFIKVDGTIAVDFAGLVNEYTLGKCNPVSYEDQSKIERTDICTEIFAHDSILALGYLKINSAPYRSACDYAVSAAPEKDKENAACTIALAYASALQLQDLRIPLPNRCLKCPGVVGQREIGQEFTVKTPNNKADVVFVVDTGCTENIIDNLISPVISEVRDVLKSRGFTDVQIAVIAYNENQLYPALITSDNGKINYQGKFSDVRLNGPKNFCENCITQLASDKKLLDGYEIVERFIKSIVPQSDEVAFKMVLDYPFRAGAAKSIVGVRSNTLEYGNLLKMLRAHVVGTTSNFDGAILHLINPIQDLTLEGVPSEKLIGFNSRLVATLDSKDNKKRQKLQFHSDMGIDFVLNNGGWIFNTQNIDKLRPEEKHKAVSQVTSSIADTLLKTETVTECKCTSVRGLHAQHKCAIKSSTFVANKKPKVSKK